MTFMMGDMGKKILAEGKKGNRGKLDKRNKNEYILDR
jgi:hypothetical protein